MILTKKSKRRTILNAAKKVFNGYSFAEDVNVLTILEEMEALLADNTKIAIPKDGYLLQINIGQIVVTDPPDTLVVPNVILEIRNNEDDYYSNILAIAPRNCPKYRGHWHPHVENRTNRICTAGNGEDALVRALSDGRLTDVVHICQAILSTYVEGEAYISLSELMEFRGKKVCYQCNSVHNVRRCKGCGVYICTDCGYIQGQYINCGNC